ncbi:DnaJ domain-containing protein [Tanacetum coccineum]
MDSLPSKEEKTSLLLLVSSCRHYSLVVWISMNLDRMIWAGWIMGLSSFELKDGLGCSIQGDSILFTPLDVWGIIDAAITFALKVYPGELKLRRDGIVDRLNEIGEALPQNEFGDFDKHKEEHCFKADQLEVKLLVADPESPEEIAWVEEGLPVACGKFKLFAQNLPALYKDWDIKWSSNPESHMEFKYEIVEVLSDFDKEHGILVAYMSVFQRTSRIRLAECCIPSSELFRFSHYIPSLKLTGKERADVPIGSFELETQACFYFSGSDSDRKACCIQRSPRGFKRNLENSVGNSPSGEDDVVEISSTTFKKRAELSSPPGVNEAIVFHDFNSDKSNWSFQKGQIYGH